MKKKITYGAGMLALTLCLMLNLVKIFNVLNLLMIKIYHWF